jgi:hypothetical protein
MRIWIRPKLGKNMLKSSIDREHKNKYLSESKDDVKGKEIAKLNKQLCGNKNASYQQWREAYFCALNHQPQKNTI